MGASGVVSLKGLVGPQSFLLPLFLPPSCSPALMCCLTTAQGIGLAEPRSLNKPFFSPKFILSAMCYSGRKLTGTDEYFEQFNLGF